MPDGYAALALVLGVTPGLLLRRTVAAMAVTLLLMASLQFAAPFAVRPWPAQPITTVSPLQVEKGNDAMSIDTDTGQMTLTSSPISGVTGSCRAP